jgi:hypothetical protein
MPIFLLVVHRRCGAREVVDLVHFKEDGNDDIMADELKVWLANQVRDVILAAGEEVVEADDLCAWWCGGPSEGGCVVVTAPLGF